MMIRGKLFASAALLATVSLPSVAAAHMGSTKALYVTPTSGGARVEARIEATDAALALGLGRSLDAAEVAQHGALLQGWLTRGITMRSDGGPCDVRAHGVALETGDKTRLVATLDMHCPSGLGLSLRDDTLFDDDPDHEVFVTVHAEGGIASHVLRSDSRWLVIGTTPGAAATAKSFVREGIVHLLTGYDHLLFLLSLILIAGLTAKRDGMRSAVTDIGWLVTAFTLGHSISLCSAALGWVSLPIDWVEAAIAASIVLVAGLNLARPEAPSRKTLRVRNLLAASFGLIHGFGFSSVLADVGLPEAHQTLALLSFNVGIELGQIACVLALLVPLAVWARRPSYTRYGVQAGSLVIAVCGCTWLVERTLAL
ncbi:MAG: HupE/UreJ family protein [Nannocystaceae bacterium]|nr:HupE/UreJ family protein [Nannocystaceae bacterium]